jgi:hypothetical protein
MNVKCESQCDSRKRKRDWKDTKMISQIYLEEIYGKYFRVASRQADILGRAHVLRSTDVAFDWVSNAFSIKLLSNKT